MLLLSKPSPETLRSFLERQKDSPFSYPEVGCTLRDAPQGYAVDRQRICLGKGTAAFHDACQALRSWKMFDLGWVIVAQPECPIEVGQTVGVFGRLPFIWTLNFCRIVQVVDEPGRRFGFAYGTLADHVAQGEERFLIERDDSDGVWYDILAISRPGKWYVCLINPLARLLQSRFRRDSAAAMIRAVRKNTGPVSI